MQDDFREERGVGLSMPQCYSLPLIILLIIDYVFENISPISFNV